MKKRLKIIFIILGIIQMAVLAGAIDVGSPAIDRAASWGAADYTIVTKQNPSNDTGWITSVEIFTKIAMTNVEVATFFTVSGNNISTRDSQALGNLALGYNQFDVLIEISTGDYIGFYYNTGDIELTNTASSGFLYKTGDQIPCTNVLFSHFANYLVSIYGEGSTEAPPTFPISAFDGVTITVWNTKEITVWNTIE